MRKIILTIIKIIGILIIAVPIIIVIGVAIFGEKTSPLSAKESYQKALEVIQDQGRDAVLTRIYTGEIPRNISGSIQRVKGRGNLWDIHFCSEEGEGIHFVNQGKKGIKEWRGILAVGCEYPEINTVNWKIDSEKAVSIAQDKAKELGKEDFIIVMIELRQEEGEKNPFWEIELFPPRALEITTCLRIIINAETGVIIEIEKPIRRYIKV